MQPRYLFYSHKWPSLIIQINTTETVKSDVNLNSGSLVLQETSTGLYSLTFDYDALKSITVGVLIKRGLYFPQDRFFTVSLALIFSNGDEHHLLSQVGSSGLSQHSQIDDIDLSEESIVKTVGKPVEKEDEGDEDEEENGEEEDNEDEEEPLYLVITLSSQECTHVFHSPLYRSDD